jgi:hypothetical protein
MIGQTWNSEIYEFTDEKTGRTIKQLTTIGNNVHLYFTEILQWSIFILTSGKRLPDKKPYFHLFLHRRPGRKADHSEEFEDNRRRYYDAKRVIHEQKQMDVH